MKILGLFCLLFFQSCLAEDLLKINQSIDYSQAQIEKNSYDARVVVQANSKLNYFKPILKKCIDNEYYEIQHFSKEIEALNKINNPEFGFKDKEIRLKLLHQHQDRKSFCEFMVLKMNRLQNQLLASNQKMYETLLLTKQNNILTAFSQFDEPLVKKSPRYFGISHYIKQSNTVISLKLMSMMFLLVIFLKILQVTTASKNAILKKISIIQYSKVFFISFVLSLPQYMLLKIAYSHHNEFMLYLFHLPIMKLLALLFCIYIYFFYKTASFKKDILLIFVHVFISGFLIGLCFEYNYLLINNFSNQEILIKKYMILICLQPIMVSVVYWTLQKILSINLYSKSVPWLFFMFTNFIFILGLMGYVDFAVNIDFIIIINCICIAMLFITRFLKASLFSILDEHRATQVFLNNIFQNNCKWAILNIKFISEILYISAIIFLIYSIIYLSFWFIPADFFQNAQEFVYGTKKIGLLSFKISTIIQAIIIFCMLNLANYAIAQWLASKLVQEKSSRQKITNLFHWLGYMFSFIIILKFIGFKLQDFMIIFGGLSLGLGLGLKNMLSSLISSVILFINPSFKKGDFIEIGKTKGYVKNISLLETTIETPDNNIMILPNQYVASSVIQNFTYENKSFQKVHLYYTIINFNVDEEEHIKSKIFEELKKNPHVLETKHHPIHVFFSLLEQATDIYRLEIVFSLTEKIDIKVEMSKINRNIHEKLKKMHLDVHYENMQYPYK